MDGDIMESILVKLNRRLSNSSRSILIFIDNAGCHPSDLRGTCTFRIKAHHCNLFLKYMYVPTKIDQSISATEVCKSVNVLVAI